jgi:hypothetical protein
MRLCLVLSFCCSTQWDGFQSLTSIRNHKGYPPYSLRHLRLWQFLTAKGSPNFSCCPSCDAIYLHLYPDRDRGTSRFLHIQNRQDCLGIHSCYKWTLNGRFLTNIKVLLGKSLVPELPLPASRDIRSRDRGRRRCRKSWALGSCWGGIGSRSGSRIWCK